MQTFLRDIGYAMRQLRKSLGFTVTAVVTLALGIGATTTIFSVVYGLLLKSLPFQEASRIVNVSETHSQLKGSTEATYPDYQDWRTQQKGFVQIAAYSTHNPDTVSLMTAGHSEQMHRVLVSGNFFSLLGTSPLVGRVLSDHDETPGNDHVAVLSAAAWRRYFGSADVVGHNIDINGFSYTIVGVLPPGAAYPAEGDVWLPLSLLDQQIRSSRVWHSVNVLGRLRPGVELPQATLDMQTIATRLAATYPSTNRNVGVTLTPLREQLVGPLRPTVLSLLGVVMLVLFVACANVASLMMVRATASWREIAIRQALGANRIRLFSQSLAQSLILCLAGGGLGTLLALNTIPLLRLALSHTPGLDPSMIQSVSLSMPVLLFAFSICTLTAILFGLLPVIKQSSKLTDALRLGDRSNTEGYNRIRGALIAGQMAVAVVVLFLSTLAVRSFYKLLAVDPGFRTDHLLSIEVTLPEPRYADGSPAANRFFEQLLGKIQQSHGVLSVSTTNVLPLKPSEVMTRFLIEGAPPPPVGTFPLAQMRIVSPRFFKTLGLSLQEGRTFEQKDIDNQTDLFVVNEAFAKRYLGGREPVGANIVLGVLSAHPEKVPVIGVVSDMHDLGVDTEAEPEIYLPGFGLHEVLLVRSSVEPHELVSTVRNAMHAIDPDQPIYKVQSIDDLLSDSLARQRMTAVLLGMFAVVTLSLASIGIYGLLSYSVVQRTREIGVRMALGAPRADILRLILQQAGRLTMIGVVVGLAVALACSRLIAGLLFHISTVDPSSFAISVGGLVLTAALAVSIPACRAMSVSPTEALRVE